MEKFGLADRRRRPKEWVSKAPNEDSGCPDVVNFQESALPGKASDAWGLLERRRARLCLLVARCRGQDQGSLEQERSAVAPGRGGRLQGHTTAPPSTRSAAAMHRLASSL